MKQLNDKEVNEKEIKEIEQYNEISLKTFTLFNILIREKLPEKMSPLTPAKLMENNFLIEEPYFFDS